MNIPNHKKQILAFIFAAIMLLTMLDACTSTEKLSDKNAISLWGENCSRCHLVPTPSAFSDGNWAIIGTHMRIRANLTDMEEKIIIEFLKTANSDAD